MTQMNFDRMLNGLLVGIVLLIIAGWLGVKQWCTVEVAPQALTLPLALKLSQLNSISMALVADRAKASITYIPWILTHRDGTTQAGYPQCAQTLPSRLFSTSLSLNIGGNKIMLEQYPLRATLHNSMYSQQLLTLLRCIAIKEQSHA